MSRQVGPPRVLAFVLLIFAALFACEISAKYIKPKPSEFEISLPLACPDTCGIWCTSCPTVRDRTENIDNNEDGNIILNPLPSGTTTDEPDSETTSKPQTGGVLELGDEDVLIPPNLRFGSPHLGSFPLSARQKIDDIIKDGVTRPETWGARPADWWKKMNGIIDESGLKLDNTPRSSTKVDYFDLGEIGWPQEKFTAGGVPSLRGSILFVAASDLGIAMGHFWESPNFVAIRNVTDVVNMNPYLVWDIEIQDNSYDTNVKNFTQIGTLDWHNATRISDKYPFVPNSPALADLVRPGMILDHRSTLWREFRLFLPRHTHRRPPGTVPKYVDEFDKLQNDLANILSIKSSDIIRHAPFYEGSAPVDGSDGPLRPTNWHNTFTYQYGTPEDRNSDADRELRVTWNGEVVAEMSRTWKMRRPEGKCYLWISAISPPGMVDDEHLDLRVRVIKTGKIGDPDELLYAEGHSYRAPYERGRKNGFGHFPPEHEIPSNMTGLERPIIFWLEGADRFSQKLGEHPVFKDWHISFRYGDYHENADDEFRFRGMETKETNVMCRGGSWYKLMPNTLFQREGLCTFQCDGK
ncbi:hypothetical protein F5X68DRAFT_230294 [Plectosphaerella plurivora]|uniref:Uncharacterized protein n=1 Tax=Plectosphaerella plurivora TaxID=936078 RepID=A0A9P8VFU6_9PEZI|nr:hypothetical protein F5X68DRAFT_230294 [Plectosphaerella plurivora]